MLLFLFFVQLAVVGISFYNFIKCIEDKQATQFDKAALKAKIGVLRSFSKVLCHMCGSSAVTIS